ncbi:YceK/YidQ family lipoprotein [Pantoea sp. Eser]|nr:YceK/YidQ family lipoprotein [Pantoea sp. Eser]
MHSGLTLPDQNGLHPRVMAPIDLLFSAALDTLLLPWDYYRNYQ